MENFNFRELIWKLSRMSLLAWAFILIIVAFLMVQIPGTFFDKIALLPTLIAFFLFYQAIFKGKM